MDRNNDAAASGGFDFPADGDTRFRCVCGWDKSDPDAPLLTRRRSIAGHVAHANGPGGQTGHMSVHEWHSRRRLKRGCARMEALMPGTNRPVPPLVRSRSGHTSRSHPSPFSSRVPAAMATVEGWWDDENERLSAVVGLVAVGIAACGGVSPDLLIGLVILAFGIEGTREIEPARRAFNAAPLVNIAPRERKRLVQTKPYQFVVGAVLAFVLTEFDVLQAFGLDTCRLLSVFGPLV